MRAAIPIFFLYLASGFVPVAGDSPTVRTTAAAGRATCDPRSLPGATPHSVHLRASLWEALRERAGEDSPRTGHRLPDGRPCDTNRLILEASPYLIQHAHFVKVDRERRPDVDELYARLYEAREQREHPGRDEKLVTAWNVLTQVRSGEASPHAPRK